MPVLDVRVLSHGATPVLLPESATIRITAVDADGPRKRLQGADFVFARTAVIEVRDGKPVRDIDLRPTDGTFCYEVRITSIVGGFKLTRHITVPDAPGPIRLGDRPEVDPKTFQPTADVVAAWADVAREASEARNAAVEASTTAAEAAEGIATHATTVTGLAAETATARDAAISAAATVAGTLDVSHAYEGLILEVRGNSWTEFGGDYSRPYTELLPAALGFSGLRERGRAGRATQDNAAIMVADVGDPGFAFDTSLPGVLLINDTGNNLMYADTPAARRAIDEGLRVMLALGSASERIEETGWTFRANQFGEAWHPTSAQPYASGGTARIGVYGGLQVDIPVPAGTSYLLCHGTDGAPGRRGMTLHISQNGVEIATRSLDGVTIPTSWEAKTGVAPVAIRLPNLSAGMITVTTDRAAVEGDAYAIIDALLPQSPTPRPILLVKPVRVTAPSHDKPEMLAYARERIGALAAEFGRHVLVIDPAPGWDPAPMLGADGLHPKPAGAQHAKDSVVADVRARVWSTAMQFALR